MQINSTESTFLNMIKQPCIEKSSEYGIDPSVMAAIGIDISNFGTSKEFFMTRNVYMLSIDKEWKGKVYSKSSGKIYDSIEDCPDKGETLYRVYTDHQDSVKDFISFIGSSRRSENGPFKYASIFGVSDYKESVLKLMRAGFLNNYLNRIGDIEYSSRLIQIIQDYSLYLWRR